MNETSLRAGEVFKVSYTKIVVKTDQMFVRLLFIQWGLCVALGALSAGGNSNVYFALLFGGLLTMLPTYLISSQAGRPLNRYVVAVSQMLFSTLVIHLSGGRIETHFHVFGSLAFLAFYRDRKVMLTATLVTALGHFVGGMYWPASVYADLNASAGRTLEHVGWVIFENVFLFQLIHESLNELWATAHKQTELEEALAQTEVQVSERTLELKHSQDQLIQQQMATANSAKNAALGEMAGQAAHEINTPLGALILITQSLMERVDKEPLDRAYFHHKLDLVMQITGKMSKIISSMRKLAGQGTNEVVVKVKLKPMIEETILLCEGRYKRASIIFSVEYLQLDSDDLECRSSEISQVLINLLNNAHDAVKNIEDLSQRWVKLKISAAGETVQFRVEDGGPGVPAEYREKLFNSSFTTKSLEEGTGFGLPICKKIAEKHGGRMYLDTAGPTTCFVLELPRVQKDVMSHMVKVG